MAEQPVVHGTCDAKFEPVKAAFAENFEKRHEIGAALAVTIDGKPVVDIWAGHADRKRTRPWERDTLVNVYSTTKGMTALCAHRLADQGLLDFDAPVAKYWPEYARNGKEGTLVRHFLGHRAGLPAVRDLLPPEALFDFDAMTRALAAEAPWWTPGEKHGYHAVTFGWLVGELVRRITGHTPGRYFLEHVAGPLGADFHIGLDETHDPRVARMSQMPLRLIEGAVPKEMRLDLVEIILKQPRSVTARAFANPPSMAQPGVVHSRAWRGAEIPAANGHTTARALARIYGALACGGALEGVRLLSREAVARCHEEQSLGMDEVLRISTRFGLGFMLSQDFDGGNFGPNPRSFGHPGAGGSVGYADPDARIGFGYVMNQMGPSIIVDARPEAIMKALYGVL